MLAFSAMLLNIVLNIFLIPLYKAQGCALSSLITQFSMAFGQILIAKKYFGLKINYVFISQILIFVTILALTAYLTTQIFTNWLIGFFVVMISGIAYAFIIKIINIKALYQMVRYGDD
jgi:peptidoglycan biosynthesis protein MviN/MurJ (putative lipid II flippase)